MEAKPVLLFSGFVRSSRPDLDHISAGEDLSNDYGVREVGKVSWRKEMIRSTVAAERGREGTPHK